MTHMRAAGTLYLVATPIGNLQEISPRTIEVLKSVNLIAAEDSRIAKKLLSALGIHKPVVSLHAHNESKQAQTLLDKLKSGESIALTSDAGTPTLSDPGAHLVSLAHPEGVRVCPISGPSAITNALAGSGFNNDHFLFLGFLPRQGKERGQVLKEIAESIHTSVFFESPNRIIQTLNELSEVLNTTRRLCIARELTKLHEEIGLNTIERWCAAPPRPQGEFTVVVEGATAVDRQSQIKSRYDFYRQHTALNHEQTLDLLAAEFSINVKRLRYLEL